MSFSPSIVIQLYALLVDSRYIINCLHRVPKISLGTVLGSLSNFRSVMRWRIGFILLTLTPMMLALQSKCYFRRRRMVGRGYVWALSMSTETQRTLAPGSHVSEMEVKKSRFLGYCKHVENWEEAQSYIEEVKAEHPKARHWCYGVRFGVNPVSERSSDDGEPSGTAGQPILGAINGEDLSDTACVVVRYFGGIKLGAGGLIRAYGGAARQVLRAAPVDILIPKSTFRVSVDGSHVGSIYDSVNKVGGSTSEDTYGEDGSLTVTITCDLDVANRLREGLRDATRGDAIFPDDDKEEDGA